MPTLVVRYQVSEEGVEPITKAVQQAFTAVADAKPDGIRYGYYRVADKPEFIALLELDEGIENPLFGIAGARDLPATIAKYVTDQPPTPEPLQVLGSYRLE